ncbi:MAG: glycosyltransferase [Promethearchaeota archaeon]|jgi:glycosyltransferase involved in cell wall biosynthesis
MKKHVVLIGLNYQPSRSTGDKNFWVTLVPLLAKGLDRLSILSIREHPQKQEELEVENCSVVIKYFSPRFLDTPDTHFPRPRIFWVKGAFPSWLGVIEKQANIRRVVIELQSIYRECPFSHIHLMDNLGPGNRIISKVGSRLNATTSVSAMAYQGKSPFLYHPYLRLSYCAPNLYIIPFSSTFKKKLLEIGVSQDRIKHILWGVASNEDSLSKNRAKKTLGLSIRRPLFLWAGYIQQIQKQDFYFALEQARNALEKGLIATFYFAFKPEAMENGFERFHKPEQGIYVTATEVELFDHLKVATDVFYSPVTNKRCILAPPLTWIEMMSLGVPILTTNVPGAFEIVEEGKTGCMAHNEDDLIRKMLLLKERAATMEIACRKKVEKDYNIRNIARRYLDFFLSRKEGNAI